MDLYGITKVYVCDAGLSAYVPIRFGESSCNNYDNGTLSLLPYPSILAKFNYYMVPEDVTSPKCLGWKDLDGTTWTSRCLPLGGNSVWASAGSPAPLGGRQGTADSGRGNGH